MNQDTINGIRAYAGLYNDLRAISGDCHYYLTPDRLKGLDAEFEGLNGIVEAVGSDPDKEGIKRMLWGFAGADWPGLLSLSGKAVEKWVNGMLTQTTKPREEIVERVEVFKVLLGKINNQTQRIAGAVGLAVPIDPVEVGKYFKKEFVKSKKWGRFVAKLQAFSDSKPSKFDVALVANEIKFSKWAKIPKVWSKWERAFAGLLGMEAGGYKPNKIKQYIKDNAKAYGKLMEKTLGALLG